MIRLLRGLFSRVPVLAGDLTVSRLDVDNGVGLTLGARKKLADLGYSERTIRELDADQRAANEVR